MLPDSSVVPEACMTNESPVFNSNDSFIFTVPDVLDMEGEFANVPFKFPAPSNVSVLIINGLEEYMYIIKFTIALLTSSFAT
jgi:hypothetical protein